MMFLLFFDDSSYLISSFVSILCSLDLEPAESERVVEWVFLVDSLTRDFVKYGHKGLVRRFRHVLGICLALQGMDQCNGWSAGGNNEISLTLLQFALSTLCSLVIVYSPFTYSADVPELSTSL